MSSVTLLFIKESFKQSTIFIYFMGFFFFFFFCVWVLNSKGSLSSECISQILGQCDTEFGVRIYLLIMISHISCTVAEAGACCSQKFFFLRMQGFR